MVEGVFGDPHSRDQARYLQWIWRHALLDVTVKKSSAAFSSTSAESSFGDLHSPHVYLASCPVSLMGDHSMKTKYGDAKVSYRPEGPSETSALLNGERVSQSTPPADVCYSTYFILYIHGIGHLLPWNFFITAKSVMERL